MPSLSSPYFFYHFNEILFSCVVQFCFFFMLCLYIYNFLLCPSIFFWSLNTFTFLPLLRMCDVYIYIPIIKNIIRDSTKKKCLSEKKREGERRRRLFARSRARLTLIFMGYFTLRGPEEEEERRVWAEKALSRTNLRVICCDMERLLFFFSFSP